MDFNPNIQPNGFPFFAPQYRTISMSNYNGCTINNYFSKSFPSSSPPKKNAELSYWIQTTKIGHYICFFCVGVVYSGEYDICGVILSVYPHRASLKNMPGHGGIRTYDLWNTSPMLFQLSYAVRTVRVSDISEQNLVPSIPMYSSNMNFFLCWCSVLR